MRDKTDFNEAYLQRKNIVEEMGFQILSDTPYVSNIYVIDSQRNVHVGRLYFNGDLFLYGENEEASEHQLEIVERLSQNQQNQDLENNLWRWIFAPTVENKTKEESRLGST